MGTFALVEGVEDGEEFVVGKGHNPLLFSNIYLFLSSLFISLEPGRLSGLLPFFLSGGLFCFVISIFLLFLIINFFLLCWVPLAPSISPSKNI